MNRVLTLTLLGFFLATAANADRVYQYRDANGHVLFTDKDIAPTNFHLVTVRHYNWHFDPSPVSPGIRDQYDAIIKQAAERYSVNPALIKAVIHAESHFNRYAVSSAGAQGLMQLMPATARSLDVTDPFNVRQNIMGGARLLSWLQKKLNSRDNVLAAYNAGIGNVTKYGGIPPFDETIRYVAKVNDLLPRYRRQFSAQKFSWVGPS